MTWPQKAITAWEKLNRDRAVLAVEACMRNVRAPKTVELMCNLARKNNMKAAWMALADDVIANAKRDLGIPPTYGIDEESFRVLDEGKVSFTVIPNAFYADGKVIQQRAYVNVVLLAQGRMMIPRRLRFRR